MVSGLQRQHDADRRRLAQLERKLEAKLEESTRESMRENDGREKWAEVQGSVKGLIDETQALTRRVESLDERLWARTSGSEAEKQRHRDLEQQVQALEQHSRLQAVSSEEAQKRQVAKLLRIDHALEDSVKRLGKLEEDLRTFQSGSQQQHHLESRLRQVQQQNGHLDARVRNLQLQVSESLQVMSVNPAPQEDTAEQGSRMEEAVQATERGMAALEKRITQQIKDLSSALASLRIKADGQVQRVSSLFERLETVNEPVLESMQAELAKARAHDRREIEGDIASLRKWVQEVMEGNEEAVSEFRQTLRQANAEIAAHTLLPGEAMAHHAVNEHTRSCERELDRSEDLEDLRRRLEWLEENGAVNMATGQVDAQQVAQMQESISQLADDVSNLMQRTCGSEVTCSDLQQSQQLQTLAEQTQQPGIAGPAPQQAVAEVHVRCTEVSRRVATLEARLLEVEGNVQFINETEDLGGVRGPPSDQGHGQYGRREASRSQAVQDLSHKLEAVAGHLEAIDLLSDRVSAVERHLKLGDGGTFPLSQPPDVRYLPSLPSAETSNCMRGMRHMQPSTPESSTSAETR